MKTIPNVEQCWDCQIDRCQSKLEQSPCTLLAAAFDSYPRYALVLGFGLVQTCSASLHLISKLAGVNRECNGGKCGWTADDRHVANLQLDTCLHSARAGQHLGLRFAACSAVQKLCPDQSWSTVCITNLISLQSDLSSFCSGLLQLEQLYVKLTLTAIAWRVAAHGGMGLWSGSKLGKQPTISKRWWFDELSHYDNGILQTVCAVCFMKSRRFMAWHVE